MSPFLAKILQILLNNAIILNDWKMAIMVANYKASD